MKIAIAATLLAAALPAAALAQTPQKAPNLSPGVIFTDAALFPKIIIIALLAAMAAAIVICVRKLLPGSRLSGGSAFISGLRAGGPLLGLLGASYGFLNMSIGVAVMQPSNMMVIAPGVAESMLLIVIGLLAGVVAVIAHWAIESRIDRQVLQP